MRIEEVRPIELTRLLNEAYHRGVDALRAVFEEMEELLLQELRRLTLPDGRPRFVGHGSRPRRFITHLGTADLCPRRVHDRLHHHTFSPLLAALGLGKKRYTLELRAAAAELATRTSYGDSSQALERTIGLRIPRRTIWDFLQEIAPEVKRALHAPSTPPPVEGSVHEADSTFVKSQLRGVRQTGIHVAISMDPDHHAHLAEVKVEGAPASVLEHEAVTHLVTDGDLGLMAHPVEFHQLCHVHFVRSLGATLQEEGVGLLDREVILAPTRNLLAHLRNSVEFHRLRQEWWAITDRVRSTLAELEGLAQRLDRGACPRSAQLIRRQAKALVVFAEVMAQGISLPATSNGIERVMGMIADRCKRKWARWGGGLLNQLVMLLARKTRPAAYELALHRYLSGGSYS